MKGSIGMPLDNFPLMALGLPNRNRCWLNQALFETKPKGILFKKLPGFFMFLFPGKSLVLFVNFFPSLSHPADRIKYLFHPIIPPSEYDGPQVFQGGDSGHFEALLEAPATYAPREPLCRLLGYTVATKQESLRQIRYLRNHLLRKRQYKRKIFSSGFLLTTSNLTWRRSFVGLLPHLSFIGDVDIPFEKYLLDLIGLYLEMDGEYLASARFDGYR